MFCWKCNKNIDISSVTRLSECPFCHADLHSCKGCKFYSNGSHLDCKENIEYPISDKEKSNFCDYFSPLIQNHQNCLSDEKKEQAKNQFNALFGD